MKKACLFDLSGTLVDTQKLDQFFVYAFGKKEMREIWLNAVMHASLVQTLTDSYYEFSEIAEATMLEMAQERGIQISADQLDEFEVEMNSLPVFGDVAPALKRLQEEGYALAVLTNLGKANAEDLLSLGDLLSTFGHVFSTDTVRKFKPAREPYHMVSDELDIPPHRIWMISAHAWDTTGATRAGLRSALVKRKGHGLTKFDRQPDVQGFALTDVIDAVIAKDHTILKHVSDWI